MFSDREQRVAVVKTLFGAFNHAAWMTDDGLSEEACGAVRNLKEGKPSGLSLFDTEEGVVIAGLFYNMYNLFGRRNVSVNGKSVEKLLALATPLKSSKAIKL